MNEQGNHRWSSQAARAILAGTTAGLAALCLDQILAVLTLGLPIPIEWSHVAMYAATGAVFALVIFGVLRLRKRPASFAGSGGAAFALLYLAPILERLANWRSDWTFWILGLIATAGYALMALVLARVSDEQEAAGLWLCGVAAAVGLAVNRNVVTYPLEPAALLADGLVVVGVIVLASTFRVWGVLRSTSVVVVAVTLGLVVLMWGNRLPSEGAKSSTERPHVLLLVIDTLRQDVFQSVLEETPEGRGLQERLAGSLFFTEGVAAAPWTIPSMGSILTGLYPQEHGLTTGDARSKSRPLTRLPAPIPTLAEHFRAEGYRTEALLANPILIPETGLSRGFDHYQVLSGPTVKLPLLTVLQRLRWIRHELYVNAEVVGRQLDRQMRRLVEARQPVFLWLHLMDPHMPLHSHGSLSDDPAASSLPQDERLYREETRYAFRELTKMVSRLDEFGFWDDALTVLVSDHGEMFPGDGHRVPQLILPRANQGHGHGLYEELMHVPLVVRPPGGLVHSRESAALVSHVDVRDTLVEMLDLPLEPFPGRVSFAPLLQDESAEFSGRELALLGGVQRGPQQRGIRTTGRKFIHYVRGKAPDELYDLRRDPGETKNLGAATPGRLERWRKRLRAQWSRLAEIPRGEGVSIDEETRRRLEALGYLN